MLSYTSGTTGDPKGVKLTHKMSMALASALHLRDGDKFLGEADTYISYLPPAHVFEQILFAGCIVYGMKCGFFGGDILKLVAEDIPLIKPTFFPSVPRLYNRIYGKIQDKLKAVRGCGKLLVNKAIASKMANLKATGAVTSGCWDGIVFKKFKALLGGRVRCMVTGSAPISAEVFDFLRIAFCAELREGYGMTESGGASTITFWAEPTSGHVGGPFANVKLRLKDIPEMNYLHTNNPPTGEICFWGPAVMKGYFKNEEKTKEALTEDGWMQSGDVGRINADMSLSIIDRAKNIFKLSQGEYIAPEKLENVFVLSSYILQAFVYGDSLKDHLVCVMVLDQDNSKKWMASNNCSDDPPTLIKN